MSLTLAPVRSRWQRFLDGASRSDTYAHVPAAPAKPVQAPRSKAGQADPYLALSPADRTVSYIREVPQSQLLPHRLDIQARDAARAEYEKPLGGFSRAMLRDMDRMMGLEVAKRLGERVALARAVAWAINTPRVRHTQNMSRFAVAPNGWSAGTMFISGLRHKPGTAPSLSETMVAARDLVARALHASDLTGAAAPEIVYT